MGSGVNKVILVGNLGKDPEVRYIQSGNAVCTLRLAVTERVKDGENGYKDQTEWVDVVVWGKSAENCGQYLAKGRQVYVEGRLQTREYEKDGVKKYKTEVIARDVQFLGGGEKGAGPQKPSGGKPNAAPSSQGFQDDDINF